MILKGILRIGIIEQNVTCPVIKWFLLSGEENDCFKAFRILKYDHFLAAASVLS